MPYPSRQPVVSLRKGLLDPLHNRRKFHPVLRLYVKGKPVILQAQGAHGEHEPELRRPKHLAEKFRASE
jgi:hypothetical protein